MTSKIPLIIAHRGSPSKKTENTKSSFRQALKDNADGLELDIFLTKDQKIVVFHDLTTKRLADKNLKITSSTYAELFGLTLQKDEKIPLLEEIFEEFLPVVQCINVEIKQPDLQGQKIAPVLADLIQKFSCEEKILVSSKSLKNLKEFFQVLPSVRLAFICDKSQRFKLFPDLALKRLNIETVNPSFELFLSKRTKRWLDKKKLWIWDANDKSQWQICLQMKAQAIITDYPDRLYQYLQDRHG